MSFNWLLWPCRWSHERTQFVWRHLWSSEMADRHPPAWLGPIHQEDHWWSQLLSAMGKIIMYCDDRGWLFIQTAYQCSVLLGHRPHTGCNFPPWNSSHTPPPCKTTEKKHSRRLIFPKANIVILNSSIVSLVTSHEYDLCNIDKLGVGLSILHNVSGLHLTWFDSPIVSACMSSCQWADEWGWGVLLAHWLQPHAPGVVLQRHCHWSWCGVQQQSWCSRWSLGSQTD